MLNIVSPIYVYVYVHKTENKNCEFYKMCAL